MKKEELQAFAQEAAKKIKIEDDSNEFRQMLTKITEVSPTLISKVTDAVIEQVVDCQARH